MDNELKQPKRSPYFFVLLFVSAHFFHHLLTAILIPLLPFIRDGFGLSYAQTGGVVSAFTLAYGFGQLPAGWIADRVGPRYMLLAGISGVALAGALIGLSGTYAAMLLFLVLLGIFGGGYHPSAAPLIAAAVPEKQRGRAIGLHIVGGSSSNFIAPLVAVFLAGYIGWRGAYLSISLPVMLFGLWLFWVLYRNDIRARRQKPHTGYDVQADQADCQRQTEQQEQEAAVEQARQKPRHLKRIVLFLIMSAAIGACTGSSVSFMPLFIVDVLGGDARFAALLLSIYFGSGMAAAPVGGMLVDRFGPTAVFGALAVLAGPALMALGFIPHWSLLAGVMLLLGILTFFRMTASEIYFVSHVPLKYRSTVLGVYFFAGMEANGIITPFLGGAIDTWGFAPAFGLIGLALTFIILTCGVLFILETKKKAVQPAG